MEPDTENQRRDGTGSAPDSASDELEIASQRLLLYLKALRIPLKKRYALVQEALSRAAALHIADNNLAAASMRCLHELLREDPSLSAALNPARFFFNHSAPFISMPAMKRSSMIPVPLERTGPVKFLFLTGVKLILAPLRPPLRIITLSLLCAALAAFYIWQVLYQQ